MNDIKDNPPPLPVKARSFLCTKCGCNRCEAGSEFDEFPQCVHCEYLGFGSDVQYPDEQVRQIEAAAFERGKDARQGEIDRTQEALNWATTEATKYLDVIDELRAKIRELEERLLPNCNCMMHKHYETTGGWECPLHGHQIGAKP